MIKLGAFSYSYKAFLIHLFTLIALVLYFFTCFLNYGNMWSIPETASQAAQQAKYLLRKNNVGTLSTVMGSPEYQGYAYASMEYYASCPWTQWDAHPLFFISRFSWNARNFLMDPTMKVTLSIYSPFLKQTKDEPHVNSKKANTTFMEQPRLTLLGQLDPIPFTQPDLFEEAWTCFSQVHPDAHQWGNLTSKKGHQFQFYQFKVQVVYWIGGFGDKHYIGLIDLPIYEKAFLTLS